jgi:precorrin-6B methylase 2
MSTLTITSTNPNLSFILSKNPATILAEKKPFERELRQGRVYGWFTKPDNKQFRLLFLDAPATCSFGNREAFEYLDLSRYSNPYLPIMMIGNTLASASTKEHELDIDEFQTEVEFTIQCPVNILARFSEMQGIQVSYDLISDKHFKVKVTDSTVIKALNLVILVCVIACLADDDTYVPLPEAGITKYLNVLNRAKAPYYLRHLFVSRAISNRALFNKLVDLIQIDDMRFQFGNTQVQRLDAIKEALLGVNKKKGESLIDIGCGELSHTVKLLGNYETITAFDGNEEIARINNLKIAKRKIENLTMIHQEIDAAWVNDNAGIFAGNDVLLSEVLEHREKAESMSLIKALMATEANRIVITVPNKSFNQYYNIDPDGFRHSDHKWEPTYLELTDFLLDCSSSSWKVEQKQIGDSVGGESVSLMAILERV